MSVYDTLRTIGIAVPPATAPAAAFLPVVRSGNLLFVSGHIARADGRPRAGQLGTSMTTEEGRDAARGVAIDIIGTLQAAVGDLNRIKRIVKLLVLVNSGPAFTEQHLVANGASELLLEAFGESGAHARSAVGVAQLPFGSCVEVELIAEIA